MNLLEELNTHIAPLGIPIETGVFSDTPPDCYLVITPLVDTFPAFADNRPLCEVQEARLSLFSKENYLNIKNQLTGILLAADFCITDRRYIGYEADIGYHHIAIDVAKEYELKEE